MFLLPIDIVPCFRGVAMFFAFLLFGFVPLASYGIVGLAGGLVFLDIYGFYVACIATLLTLFCLGFVKNKIAEQPPLCGGLVMLLQGAGAGAFSYWIGTVVAGGGGFGPV